MGVVARKAEIREFLANREYDAVLAWSRSVRSPQRVLFSLALDADEVIAWRAVECIGQVAGIEAEENLERIRDMIRRLFWLMNDESGGLGWRSPEMIGEILVNVPSLIEEFGLLLTAYFHEEPFERGSYLAVARIAAVNPQPFTGIIPDLREALVGHDAVIRCHAATALWNIDSSDNPSVIEPLKRDSSPVTFYDYKRGIPVETTVGRFIESLMKSAKTQKTHPNDNSPV